MKQYLIILFISLFVSVSVSGQKFTGGLKGGLVGSQVAGDTYSGYKKAGINAGAWINLALSEKSLIQMELGYIQKGSRENPDYEKNKMDSYVMQLGYVELPFLYRYTYNDFLGFEAGLSMNFLLHHRERKNGYQTVDSPFRRLNLCFVGGLTMKISERVNIVLRTDNSLFSIRKNRVTGDVWRFWDYGQYSDALILSAYYTL